MGSEWRNRTLAELSSFLNRGAAPAYIDEGGVLVLNQKCVRDQRVIYELGRRTDPERRPIAADRMLRPFDVLVNSTGVGTLGRVAQVRKIEEPATVDSHLTIVRPNPEAVDPLYLGMAIRCCEHEIRWLGEGSTGQTELSRERLSKFTVPVPESRDEQRAIAHILGTLDDKIELNRRMNQTLEEMARAIFKSWFVDFDPVRAKAAVRRKHPKWSNAQVSRAACPKLKPEIAELFPDEFENSELGEIPKGWRVSQVGHHFRLTMGQSPPGSTYNEIGEGIPFYQGRSDFGFRYPTRRVYCTEPTRFAEPGDTLVSVRAPVGDINMAVERCAIGRGVAAIRHESGSRSFTYCTMHQLAEHFNKFEAEGSVFGCINKTDFERLPFLIPLPEVLATFDRVVSPLDDRVEIAERQTADLTALRETLLPKLISGELRVKDAEKFLKERGL